jgi:hypothetical protein
MPRGDYLKYFAKDTRGNYIGTEPQRAWTELELEERYGRYRRPMPKPVFRARNLFRGEAEVPIERLREWRGG